MPGWPSGTCRHSPHPVLLVAMLSHLISAEPAAPSRILVVDDSPMSVRLMASFLRDLGQVHFATSGERALDAAIEVQPHIVLLDVEMPGMDGYEVCRRFKALPALRDIPIIFVTAHNDVEHELRGLEAGAVDFIPKPINEPIVRARVRTHLTLKHQTDLLRELAAHDGLTGAFNRRSFDERIVQEVRRHHRQGGWLALAMIDIDCFKAYNDHYGHQQGDDCLRLVAQALTRAARRPGDMLARYGGEEFALILPRTEPDGLVCFGEMLCESVRGLQIPHAASSAGGNVSISVGLAVTDARLTDAARLIGAADRALYRAKAAGRDGAVLIHADEVGGTPDADS